MPENLHSSLPIEYQLKYGTAIGNANISDFVNQSTSFSVFCGHPSFPQEQFFGVGLLDTSPFLIDVRDPSLVRLNRR